MNEMSVNETKPNELSLTLSRRIAAAPAKVYDTWLSPETFARFMANCEGMTLAAAEIDARVGGRFLLVMRAGGKDWPQPQQLPHVQFWHQHLLVALDHLAQVGGQRVQVPQVHVTDLPALRTLRIPESVAQRVHTRLRRPA